MYFVFVLLGNKRKFVRTWLWHFSDLGLFVLWGNKINLTKHYFGIFLIWSWSLLCSLLSYAVVIFLWDATLSHYQGNWYKKKDVLDSTEEKTALLSGEVMDAMRSSIGSSRDKEFKFTNRIIYDKARESALLHGVEWIVPVERPAQYHSKWIEKTSQA